MNDENKIFAHKRIGIFGKGGSGKSTVTVLLAKAFTSLGYQVCVLDADSTNMGIHQAMGFEQAPESLMEYFGGTVFFGGPVTCPVDDPTPLTGAEVSLSDIPDKYYCQDNNGLFLFQLGKIGDKGPGAGCDGPNAKIARDLNIEGIGDNIVTLIDAKAGLEDFARGVITTMDWVITVVDPSLVSIQIAENIKELIAQIKAGILPATKYLEEPELIDLMLMNYQKSRIKESFVLLNNVDGITTETFLKDKLLEKGINPVGVIDYNPSISLSWLKGLPLADINTEQEVYNIVRKIEFFVKQ